MDRAILKIYDLVRQRVDEETFETELAKRVQFYDNMLSSEAVAYILADEWGADIAETAHISDLKHGDSANLSVSIVEIGQVRTFSRRNGTQGRVVNITITDGTGQCRLTLWDNEVENVTGGRLVPAQRLRILNGYVKVTDFGMEINLGRWGKLYVE